MVVDYTPTTIGAIQSTISSGMQALEHTIGNVRFIGDVTITKVQNWGVVFDASFDGEKIKCAWFQRNATLKDHTVYVICGKAQNTPYGMQIRVHSTEEDTAQISQTEKLTRLCTESGWFERKKKVDFLAYRRIGILSKTGSKGYDDFITQLRIPCERVLVEIALEGPKTESDIIRGISELTRASVDCILIIRGGGDFLDMSNSYDREPIFKSIVECAVPVISAIGHSNDDLLINRVCDFHTETPTTLACFIRGKWRDVMLQAYHDQRQHIAHHLATSYGVARRHMVDRLHQAMLEAREQFEVAKRAELATICPLPMYDMSDIGYADEDDAPHSNEHSIVVRLADGSYHRARLSVTRDRLDAATVDEIHRVEIDGADRTRNAPLAKRQKAYRDLRRRYERWRDRPFGGNATHADECADACTEDDSEADADADTDADTDADSASDHNNGPCPLADEIARLEQYKTQLDLPEVQPCTLDVLHSVDATRADTLDVPGMMSLLRQLRYFVHTHCGVVADAGS